MRAKLSGLSEALAGLDELDFEQARERLSRWNSIRDPSVLDGPLMSLAQGVDDWGLAQVFQQVAQARALIVALALSAFKHDHDTYPEKLDTLTPTYLDAVPLDAYCHEPMRYERAAGGLSFDLGMPVAPRWPYVYIFSADLPHGWADQTSYFSAKRPERPDGQ